jgi:protein-S-isoprenylcysteine O-methyltransferase Ste14
LRRYAASCSHLISCDKLQRPLLFLTCALEFLTIAHYHILRREQGSPELASSLFCPASSHTGTLPYLSVTPITLFGILLMAFGTFLRLRCYEALGSLFTFDLCIKPEHRLVTSGPYSFVRHPSYLGSLCLTAGLTFAGLTRGSWIIECAVGPHRADAMFATQCAWISWWVYTGGVGYTRAVAEDEQMRKRFGEEWERYAMKVRYWFVPGLV